MDEGETRQDTLEEASGLAEDVSETIADVEGSSSDTSDSGDEPNQNESDDDSDSEDESDEDDGRIVITLDEPAEFDLVELQGDAQAFINEEILDVGEYSQIKLRVGDVVNAVLTDGSQAEVVTPGNAPLMFKQDFEIRANTRTEFTADFAPHRRGNNGYILRPVATETTVSYTEIESSDDDSTEDSDSDSSEDADGSDSSSDDTTDDTTDDESSGDSTEDSTGDSSSDSGSDSSSDGTETSGSP